MWFRNERVRGYSRWHWDDTPPMPSVLAKCSVDIRSLPLAICGSVNHNLMLSETQNEDPPKSECCPMCWKAVMEHRGQLSMEMDVQDTRRRLKPRNPWDENKLGI